MSENGERVVKVEKGEVSEEELAALTAVLLARAFAQAAAQPTPVRRRGHSGPARWRRLERQQGFCAPHSWRG